MRRTAPGPADPDQGPHPDPDLARLAARRRSAAADAVSVVLDPTVVLAASVLLVCLLAVDRPAAALGWAALTLVFVVVLPWLVLVLALRSGRVDDRQVVVRAQRHGVMWPATLSVALGLLLLVVLGAPVPVLRLVAAVLAGALVVGAVTLLWKASVHVAVLASAGTVLVAELAPRAGDAVRPLLAVLLVLVVVLGWARWRAGRHTVAQVVAGAALGAATAALAVAVPGLS